MFRKGSKIIYPRHGAGKVKNKKAVEIDGKKEDYYILSFFDSPVTVSVPQEKAEDLGLREPLSQYKARKVLKELGNTVKITDNVMKNLDEISKENLLSGELEDAVHLYNLLRSLARKKEKENKNFSYSATQTLETTVNFIRSEVKHVLGEGAVQRYKPLAEEK